MKYFFRIFILYTLSSFRLLPSYIYLVPSFHHSNRELNYTFALDMSQFPAQNCHLCKDVKTAMAWEHMHNRKQAYTDSHNQFPLHSFSMLSFHTRLVLLNTSVGFYILNLASIFCFLHPGCMSLPIAAMLTISTIRVYRLEALALLVWTSFVFEKIMIKMSLDTSTYLKLNICAFSTKQIMHFSGQAYVF